MIPRHYFVPLGLIMTGWALAIGLHVLVVSTIARKVEAATQDGDDYIDFRAGSPTYNLQRIGWAIGSAKRKVVVLAESLDPALADDLVRAKANKAEVVLVLDREAPKQKWFKGCLDILGPGKVEIRLDQAHRIRGVLAVIDERRTFMASFAPGCPKDSAVWVGEIKHPDFSQAADNHLAALLDNTTIYPEP